MSCIETSSDKHGRALYNARMKRFHISISTEDFAASLADYSVRLECKPCVVAEGRYALWRTPTLNFSISCKPGQKGGMVRHIGFEDDDAEGFSEQKDANGITWEYFTRAAQEKEIEEKFAITLPKNKPRQPDPSIAFRLLTEADVEQFRECRLHALKHAPQSFLESYEDLMREPVEFSRRRFQNGWIAGAFYQGKLIGISGLYRHRGKLVQHKGTVWGVYVMPDMRGKGISRKLIEMVLDEAKTAGIEMVTISTDIKNEVTMSLYQQMGFSPCGMEPHILKLDDRYVDDVAMVQFLSGPNI